MQVKFTTRAALWPAIIVSRVSHIWKIIWTKEVFEKLLNTRCEKLQKYKKKGTFFEIQ